MLLSTLATIAAAIQATSVIGDVLESRAGISTTPTPGKLRVIENSGVCETTKGVYQATGYGDLSTNSSVW